MGAGVEWSVAPRSGVSLSPGERVRMEWSLGADVQTADSEGGLREMVLQWFTEAQGTLIQHNGNFPAWFRGFTARKDAEDLLRDKTMGCFLIRLSDKVLGYILSYKGHTRCRHFVINQNKAGLFVLEGDRHSHHSLKELIAHYKFSPIQPYGEYLTRGYSESNPSELYDVVRSETQERSGVSVQVLKSWWGQMTDENCSQNNVGKITQQPPQQSMFPDVQPPALPSKTKTRKSVVVSADPVSLSQDAPPVPTRGPTLSQTLSKTFTYTSSNYSQVQPVATDPKRGGRARAAMPAPPSDVPEGTGSKRGGNPFSTVGADRRYNDHASQYKNHVHPGWFPVEHRSTSMPSLDRDTGEGTPTVTLRTSDDVQYAAPQKRVTCQTYSLHNPRDAVKQYGKSDHRQMDHYHVLQSNPLYQASEGLGETLAWHGGRRYSEAPEWHAFHGGGSDDNHYEPIEASPAIQGNHYETLEDLRSNNSKFTRGKTNIRWPKFLPEYKKK